MRVQEVLVHGGAPILKEIHWGVKAWLERGEGLHIVLINPEIPQNTGNIGRTCVGLNAPLHLVGRPGFSLEDRYLKRAGLDYWSKLELRQHADWAAFEAALLPEAQLYFFSTRGKRSLFDVRFSEPAYLLFGSESRGFPAAIYRDKTDSLVRIPASAELRSLNLAVSVGIAAYEAYRQLVAAKSFRENGVG